MNLNTFQTNPPRSGQTRLRRGQHETIVNHMKIRTFISWDGLSREPKPISIYIRACQGWGIKRNQLQRMGESLCASLCNSGNIHQKANLPGTVPLDSYVEERKNVQRFGGSKLQRVASFAGTPEVAPSGFAGTLMLEKESLENIIVVREVYMIKRLAGFTEGLGLFEPERSKVRAKRAQRI